MTLISENKDAYDTIAAEFSRTREYLWDDLRPLETFVQEGNTVLDLGCGNGRVYQMCESVQGCRYIGVDQSEQLIKIAEERFPQGKFLVTEMQSIPLETGTVDVVFCIASFHHLPDHESRVRTLREIRRVLKQTGICLMLNWNLEGAYVQGKIASGAYEVDEKDGHVIIPWRDGEKKVKAVRHYWDIRPGYLDTLSKESGLECIRTSYLKRGETVPETESDNIFTIIVPME